MYARQRSTRKRNIRDTIREDDRDSGNSSSSQRNEDDDIDYYSKSDRNVTSPKTFLSSMSSVSSHPHASSHSSPPRSSSPHSPDTSPIYSFPASSGSVTMTRAAKIPPRCAAPRDRSIAKYPPPFHPDATPNPRINFHVAVKKACASHHTKVLTSRPKTSNGQRFPCLALHALVLLGGSRAAAPVEDGVL